MCAWSCTVTLHLPVHTYFNAWVNVIFDGSTISQHLPYRARLRGRERASSWPDPSRFAAFGCTSPPIVRYQAYKAPRSSRAPPSIFSSPLLSSPLLSPGSDRRSCALMSSALPPRYERKQHRQCEAFRHIETYSDTVRSTGSYAHPSNCSSVRDCAAEPPPVLHVRPLPTTTYHTYRSTFRAEWRVSRKFLS
jgi:hypothetical protein